MSTDVSEEHVASIFRVEEQAEQETSVKAGGKQRVFSSACSSTLKWMRYVPPKRRLTFNGIHGVISQKVGLFITTAVRT
jgi:hypothetical protein